MLNIIFMFYQFYLCVVGGVSVWPLQPCEVELAAALACPPHLPYSSPSPQVDANNFRAY